MSNLYGTFTIDISQFTRFPNFRTEITVKHLCGKPYEITAPSYIMRMINGSVELDSYIEAAAKNNYETLKKSQYETDKV